MDPAVVSVTQIHAGTNFNVIPAEAVITGTTRALTVEVQDLLEARVRQVVAGVCAAHGLGHAISFERRYAPPVNTAGEPDMPAAAPSSQERRVGQEGVGKSG